MKINKVEGAFIITTDVLPSIQVNYCTIDTETGKKIATNQHTNYIGKSKEMTDNIKKIIDEIEADLNK